MNQPLAFTDNAYATSSSRADATDTSPARQFPAAWRPWGAGGDLDTSDVDDDAVLSAMRAAGALEHSPTDMFRKNAAVISPSAESTTLRQTANAARRRVARAARRRDA